VNVHPCARTVALVHYPSRPSEWPLPKRSERINGRHTLDGIGGRVWSEGAKEKDLVALGEGWRGALQVAARAAREGHREG